MSKLIDANIKPEDFAHCTLTDLAERLCYDEATVNAVCERMLQAVERILQRKIDEDDTWPTAEAELTTTQRLAVWLEAIETI